MNTYTYVSQNRGSWIGCMSLALLATMLSLSLSVFTGWQLGEAIGEKLIMAAFGVLAVLGAHALLALCRPASTSIRLTAVVLWLFCIIYVAYSHASFFCYRNNMPGCVAPLRSIGLPRIRRRSGI